MSAFSEKLKAYPFYLLPHHAISWLMFKLARVQFKPFKNFAIAVYTRLNPVNMSEAMVEDKFAYESLNAFFTRALKPEARPFCQDENTWLCPVDGSVSQAGDIIDGRVFQAKGHDYSLLELVGGDEQLAAKFHDGHFATLYLSPRDYHRIHMPLDGALTHMTYVPGRLFSVATHTVNQIPRLFARNERCVCAFETDDGPMVMVLVGAINVSAIETVWHGLVNRSKLTTWRYQPDEVSLQRGEEMGCFNLGSTVIVLADRQIQWDEHITPGQTIRLGQKLAKKVRA